MISYQLCYYAGGKERIFDTVQAESDRLVFKGVPSGALYILHDLTAGTEERVFSVDNRRSDVVLNDINNKH